MLAWPPMLESGRGFSERRVSSQCPSPAPWLVKLPGVLFGWRQSRLGPWGASWNIPSHGHRREADCPSGAHSPRLLEALHPLRREHHFTELPDQNLIIPGATSLSSGVPVTWPWEMGQRPGQSVPPGHVGSTSSPGCNPGAQTLSQVDTTY